MSKMSQFIDQHGSLTLTILSSIGVIGTGVAAAKGGMTIQKIDGETPIKEMDSKDQAKLIIGSFWPAIGIAAGTIACILGNHHLTSKQAKAMVGAFQLIDKEYKTYRDEVIKRYGKEEDRDIIAKKSPVVSSECSEVRVLWHEPISDRYFYRSETEVIDAEGALNRKFAIDWRASLNDFYVLLGLPPTDYGEATGWDAAVGEIKYGYRWIDFTHVYHPAELGKEAYYSIVMDFEPTDDYEQDVY